MPRGGYCNCDKQGGYSEEYFNTEEDPPGLFGGKKKARRKPRKLSEYNKFMKKEIPIVKKNNPNKFPLKPFIKIKNNFRRWWR